MAEQAQVSKWSNVIPTAPTTFPTLFFILYMLCILLLLPIHSIVCLVNLAWKLIMYLLNKLFYCKAKSLLEPIIPSSSSYVIITGSASGIGKDIALLYAKKGFSLILIDINTDIKSYANELKNKYSNQSFRHLIVDLSKSNASETIYNTVVNDWKILNIDILVNNAGFGMTGDFLNHNINTLRTMTNVNCLICMELGHRFGQYFVLRGKGRICQIASVAAYVPGSHAAIYHATKSYVRSWALAFGHELIGTGVGVTVISPGPVLTQFAAKSDSTKSLIFNPPFRSIFCYNSLTVANTAVESTLSGKREVTVGPLWAFLQAWMGVYGEAFMIISTKFLWQDPKTLYRSPYASINEKLKKDK